MRDWVIENCIIYVCTTVLVVAVCFLTNSAYGLWGLLMLSLVNHPK